MARRVMGLALLYTLLVLLAPTDADGAFFKGVSSQQSFSASPRVDRPPRSVGVEVLSRCLAIARF